MFQDKLRKLALILGAISLLTPIQALYAGGENSGGGDNRSGTFESAWFVGPRTIQYCYEAAPGFGMGKQEIESTIEKAFSTWQDYLKKNQIYTKSPINDRLVLTHKLVSPCNGGVDLKFLFGVTGDSSDQVETSKKQFSNPTAFSRRVHYDRNQRWSQGYIWVAGPGAVSGNNPDWTKPYSLLAIVIHELGHVLGCGHVDGTIMTANIAQLLNSTYNNDPIPGYDFRKSALTEIDGKRRLDIFCESCDTIYPGGLDLKNDFASKETFKRFTGRDARGKIRAELLSHADQTFVLTLIDDAGKVSLPIDTSSNLKAIGGFGYSDSTPTFKVQHALLPSDNSEPGWTQHHLEGIIIYGQLTIQSATPLIPGSTYTVLLSVNMDSGHGPYTIKYISGSGNVNGVLFDSYGPTYSY